MFPQDEIARLILETRVQEGARQRLIRSTARRRRTSRRSLLRRLAAGSVGAVPAGTSKARTLPQ